MSCSGHSALSRGSPEAVPSGGGDPGGSGQPSAALDPLLWHGLLMQGVGSASVHMKVCCWAPGEPQLHLTFRHGNSPGTLLPLRQSQTGIYFRNTLSQKSIPGLSSGPVGFWGWAGQVSTGEDCP